MAFSLKLCASVSGLLCFYLAYILIILKSDGYSAVSTWSWSKVFLPCGSATMFFFFLWACVNYLSSSSKGIIVDPSVGFSYTRDAARKFLHRVDVANVVLYHEMRVFRDVVLLVVYSALIAFSVLVTYTPCTGCHTPFKMFSIGAAVTYGLRLLWLFLAIPAYLGWIKTMTSELRRYQQSPDDDRLFFRVVPQLAHGSAFTFCSFFLPFSFCACTVILAALAGVWLLQGDCRHICPRQYATYEYLLAAVFVVEGCYFLSFVILRYLRRVMAAEAIGNLMDGLNALIQSWNEDEDEETGSSSSARKRVDTK